MKIGLRVLELGATQKVVFQPIARVKFSKSWGLRSAERGKTKCALLGHLLFLRHPYRYSNEGLQGGDFELASIICGGGPEEGMSPSFCPASTPDGGGLSCLLLDILESPFVGGEVVSIARGCRYLLVERCGMEFFLQNRLMRGVSN